MSLSQDNRYAAALESLVASIDLVLAGIGIVVVPSGEQSIIAGALAQLLRATVLPLDQVAATGPVVSRTIAAGLPADSATAVQHLTQLNGRRDFISSKGRLVVLVISSFEIVQVQRYAADVYSALRFLKVVHFIPDLTVNESSACAVLARHDRERFGRLDLRGFVRSEAEDVSFSIEDIYQVIQARYVSRARLHLSTAETTIDRTVSGWLDVLARDRPIVLLGHPGSGKTFLLRWLALAGVGSEQASPSLGFPVGTAAQLPLPIEGSEQANPPGVVQLPVLLSLAAYAQAPQPMDLLEYITEILLSAGEPAAHIIHKAIADRRAVFLLDGLDEVGDDMARHRTLDSVRRLHEQTSGCLVIVTCRLAGYGPDVLEAHHLRLTPFSDDVIKSFLVRWCELYAVARLGDFQGVRRQGQVEGEVLAADVLGSSGVRALARNPLLLTVLAIVHRAGVRLPDHRIELYAHATRVLVERWNRVRSLAGDGPAPPLKAVDAVRLLGPLALRTVASGASAVVDEGALRAHLERALAAGTLRGVASADDLIAIFRNDLGLLVEQAPGVYAFLHLTLAEYFAAWELVRSDALDRLASDATRVYLGQYREVILLAAGELGVLRGDDERLNRLVATLVDSAAQRMGRPSPTVPSLLAGLLADDPHLTLDAARRIVDEIIPKWWFKRSYGRREALPIAIEEATGLLWERIANGRLGNLVRTSIERAYGSGFQEGVFLNLARGGAGVLGRFLDFLRAAGVDYGPHVLIYLSSGKIGPEAVGCFRLYLTFTADESSSLSGTFRVSRQLDELVRSGMHALQFKLRLFRPVSTKGRLRAVDGRVIPWSQTSPTGEQTQAEVTLAVNLPKGTADTDRRTFGFVTIQPGDPASAIPF